MPTMDQEFLKQQASTYAATLGHFGFDKLHPDSYLARQLGGMLQTLGMIKRSEELSTLQHSFQHWLISQAEKFEAHLKRPSHSHAEISLIKPIPSNDRPNGDADVLLFGPRASHASSLSYEQYETLLLGELVMAKELLVAILTETQPNGTPGMTPEEAHKVAGPMLLHALAQGMKPGGKMNFATVVDHLLSTARAGVQPNASTPFDPAAPFTPLRMQPSAGSSNSPELASLRDKLLTTMTRVAGSDTYRAWAEHSARLLRGAAPMFAPAVALSLTPHGDPVVLKSPPAAPTAGTPEQPTPTPLTRRPSNITPFKKKP